jgi:AIPR protein
LEELYDDIEIPKNEVTLKIIPNEHFIKKLNYHDENETPIETIVTSIVASSLKPIIEEKKELVLALNVRYYKGENDINSKIKQEYSKGKKSNFWILNNGINAICEHFEVDGDKLTIKNFQIVNGGQTTKTLTRIVNDLPDEVQILMRLTKIQDKPRTSKISMDIAVASNSQNAISARDLHSGDRIQNKIFADLDAVGIFYDKKDGEWATVSKSKYRNPHGNSPMHLKIHNRDDLGIAYLSFFLQIPISSVGRNKLVFSELYYDQIFSMSANEDDQFSKLMLAHRISERVNRINSEKKAGYEILQNNYISDVIVALTAIYFFKENLSKIGTIEELTDKLKEIKGQSYLKPAEKYILNLDQSLDDFIIEITKSVQYILDTKKEAKKEFMNEEWLPTDTNNWLKKDTTYKEIYEKVIKRLKQ